MLINIFGWWLMSSNIVGLYHKGEAECNVITVSGGIDIRVYHSCNEVAAEINKQLRETNQ